MMLCNIVRGRRATSWGGRSHGRPVVITLLVMLSAMAGLARGDDGKLYGRRVAVPTAMQPDLKAAVGDLLSTLHQLTGQEFALAGPGEAAGIVLQTIATDEPPQAGASQDGPGPFPPAVAERLGAGREACLLWPEAGRLWIAARSDIGLCHGVYLYLEALGVRWYGPSERWTIVPRRDDVRLSSAVAASPAFRSRLFFGTGGFGGNLPLDPRRTLQERWLQWHRRNRFGGEFRVAGHTGEAFNTRYKQELEANPAWRAMIDGRRVPWSLTAKFCASNQDVVDLYVRDRVEDFRRRRSVAPHDPHAWAVSVEPADGGGHCTCPDCLKLGSVSDRVFHVANQAARAVRDVAPDGRVSLFAYNEHAAPPSFPLEPNVYVQAIPYAFQRTGLSPDQLLDAWSQHVPRLGVYDYWSIPDWSRDLPSFDPLGFGPDRLRGWHARGVDSFLCESTFSHGAMGAAWWIGSRLAWEPQTDVASLFEEFLHDSFGPGKAPMRRMLTRWADRFTLTSHELALSFRDLDEAWRLAEGDEAVQSRIADYGRYVEYLRLNFEYQQAPRGSPEKRAAAERLLRFQWSIYDSAMIHAFRLSQLLTRDARLAGDETLGKTYDWQNPAAPGWAEIQPADDPEIRRRVQAGVRELQPQNFVSRRFRGPLVRAVAAADSLGASTSPATSDHEAPVMALSNSLDFHVLAERDGVAFRPRIATERAVQLLVAGPDGESVAVESVETGPEWAARWSTPEIVLPRAGLYHVQIISQKRSFRFSPPPDLPLTMPGWWNSQGAPTPRLYFYVPRETSLLAIYANYTAAGPPRFFAPDGVEVQPQALDQGHLLLIPIAEEHRGRIWSLDRAKCAVGPLEMLNAPAAFAFSPQTLLAPRDALEEEEAE